jgi:hypothetical protein
LIRESLTARQINNNDRRPLISFDIDDYLILNLLEMPMMIVFVLLVMVNILPSYIVVNKLVELADIVIVSPVLVLSFLGKKII